ncbi:MAG: hypothetical protein RBU35_20405 [Anaerolineae bacterium]|jgi:hypothetical protein|nr:hypothetical protein [Anaerolineae bacterium]
MKSICNFGYARGKRGGGSFPNVRGLLKYLQYRDNRNDHIPMAGGPERWVDGGLGTCYQHILSRLDELSPANRHAYCHALVISPDPEALAGVEGDPSPDGDLRQARFVEAVREAIEEWEAWRLEHDRRPQVGPIEYSLVVHRPARDYGEQMHAHVILAAATEDPLTRERTPLYNNRAEIDAFKETVYRQLDRVYELDREREREREQPEPERGRTAEPEIEPGPSFDLEMSL